MNKIRLAVIFGGKSSEYSVSLHSAGSAIRALDLNKYDITFVGITEEGDWYLYEGDVDAIEHDHWLSGNVTPVTINLGKEKGLVKLGKDGSELIEIDCVLPILHGPNGEDGTLQGLLELCAIPYVGCNHLSSAMSMDKDITHIICKNANILMADYVCAYNSEHLDINELFKEVCDKLKFPVFVKPANAGSSYGISKIDNNYVSFKEAIEFAFKYDKKVIIETGIDGFEVGCAVMGNDYDNLTVGEVDEIDTKNSFFDFEAKYALENTEIVCPARLSTQKSDEIKNNARIIYKAMQCSGLARIDMFVDKNETVYFNELNTIPGMTATSRYPSMMKAIDMDFTSLLDNLIELAMSK